MKSLNGRNLKKKISCELLKGQNWTHEKKILLNFFSIFFFKIHMFERFLQWQPIIILTPLVFYLPHNPQIQMIAFFNTTKWTFSEESSTKINPFIHTFTW
jgi:hypothetical protein